MENNRISTFVKYNRIRLQMTQSDLAQKSGVGLRFIRELEQGKASLRLDKVNQVLALFGHTIAPAVITQLDPYEILLHYVSKNVTIQLNTKKTVHGLLTGPVYDHNQLTGWRLNTASTKNKAHKNPAAEEIIPHAVIQTINES